MEVNELSPSFPLRKFMLIVLIASLSLSALIGIILLLIGKFCDTESKIISTTVSIGISSLMGLCCAAVYDKKNLRVFSFAGVVTCLVFLAVAAIMIWTNFRNHNLEKPLGTSIILMVSFSQVALLLLVRADIPVVSRSLVATIFTIGVVALLLLVSLWHGGKLGEFYYRLLGVFGILDVLGTLLTPILAKVTKK